ncbi:10206_t:CDS:1, partial [Scutellospora calospora]
MPGNVVQGATITITWADTISSSITLSVQSYQWTVNVPAGTYYIGLNNGSGNKLSGTFTVFTAASASVANTLTATSSPIS